MDSKNTLSLENTLCCPRGDAKSLGWVCALGRWTLGRTRAAESLLGASSRGRCGGPAAGPQFLLLCKLLLFALTNLFFLFFCPPPLHPFLIAASNSHTHSSLLTWPFGISTWHLQSSSFWKGKEKKKTLLKKKKKQPGPCALQGTWLPPASWGTVPRGESAPGPGEGEPGGAVRG